MSDIKECPVFYPTMEEFQDFSGYLERVEATIGYAGIFKVSIPLP